MSEMNEKPEDQKAEDQDRPQPSGDPVEKPEDRTPEKTSEDQTPEPTPEPETPAVPRRGPSRDWSKSGRGRTMTAKERERKSAALRGVEADDDSDSGDHSDENPPEHGNETGAEGGGEAEVSATGSGKKGKKSGESSDDKKDSAKGTSALTSIGKDKKDDKKGVETPDRSGKDKKGGKSGGKAAAAGAAGAAAGAAKKGGAEAAADKGLDAVSKAAPPPARLVASGIKGGKKFAKSMKKDGIGGAAKKGLKEFIKPALALLSPLLMVGLLLVMVLISVSGMSMSMSQNDVASGQYAMRDGTPGSALMMYQQIGNDNDVQWQILAAIGRYETNHGMAAPDGKVRIWPYDADGKMMEDYANDYNPDDYEKDHPLATATTVEFVEPEGATTTTEVPHDGDVFPITDPPIVDDTPISNMAPTNVASESMTTTTTAEGATSTTETPITVRGDTTTTVATTTTAPVTTTTQQDIKVQGGPWYGMMLVEEEAWNTYVEEQKAISDKAEVDVQKPYDSTVYVARQINAIKVEQKFGPDGSFEMEKEGWLAVIKALPLKGLSDGQNSDIVAGTIYNTALAWMNQTPACGSGSQSGVSGIPLPTSGPLKIGDILAYKGHNIPLTQQRWANAVLIVDVGKSMGVPERGQIIALATAIVELNLLNGQVAVDHDSVGLFQQRPASGWGTKEQVGDAIYSSRAFYGGPTGPNKGNPPGLLDHAGWEAMEPGVAAQDVQVSAYPGKYAEAIPDAAAILATIKESNATYGVTQSTPVGWFPIIDSDSSPLPNGTPSDTSGSGATTTTAAGATTTTAAGATTTGGEATTTTVAGTPATPARVLLIGDSLTDGAKTAGLPSEWTVDAKVGRPTSEAPEIVTKEAPNSDAIIIALGTNDYTSTKEDFAAKIKSVMDMVGTTKQVQWVNVDTGSTKLGAAKDGVNAALTEATSTYPNLKVADWDAAAKTSMEGKRADDGIHYTVEGYKVYAEFLKGLATGLPATPATDCSVSGGGDGMIVNIDSGAPVAVCPIGNAETNCQMVPIINQLIADAAADGVPMAVGNSYRSVTLQIELRKKHCGTSQYAIYEMPSGSCRPPTAKPGQSQHQKGLAIDWANCSTRATACYKWLAQNAAKYGLKNLPSESWHWSTTGS